MGKKREKTIQSQLLKKYFVLILLIVLLFLAIIFSYNWNMLIENTRNSLSQRKNLIQSELEMQMNEADQLQRRLLFSERFQNIIFSSREMYQNSVENIPLRMELEELSDLIYEPDDYSDFQMNYWNLNGGCIGIGYNSFMEYRPEEIQQNALLREVLANSENHIISSPYITEWAGRDAKVLSIFKKIEKKDTSEKIIVETQISYHAIQKCIEKNLKQSNVIVLNREKEPIYVSKKYEGCLDEFIEKTKMQEKKQGKISFGNGTWIFGKTYSEKLDWEIWVMENESECRKPFVEMIGVMLLISCLVLISVWRVTKALTKQLTIPLLAICEKMSSVDLRRLEKVELKEIEGCSKELKEVDNMFNQMCLHLIESKKNVQIAMENEVQAKLLAMQSQMNPHFLYNILAIIKIMGKEAKSNSIVEICTELSLMLRYISSSDFKMVTIKEEEEHTRNYLKLMHTRFQEDLIYDIDIPEKMEQIPIPKLVLQPLVENSIKYATNEEPPWKISVRGRMDGEKWYLDVKDDGPGINEEKMRELEMKLKTHIVSQHSDKVEIGGMGILNIYSRLKLMYGEEAVFKIENHSSGGLVVTIGGTIDGK